MHVAFVSSDFCIQDTISCREADIPSCRDTTRLLDTCSLLAGVVAIACYRMRPLLVTDNAWGTRGGLVCTGATSRPEKNRRTPDPVSHFAVALLSGPQAMTSSSDDRGYLGQCWHHGLHPIYSEHQSPENAAAQSRDTQLTMSATVSIQSQVRFPALPRGRKLPHYG